MSKITTPLEHFGFTPGADGELARWDKIVEYFYLLEKQSDRISVTDMGPSTEGNPFLKVIITSPENHKNLEEIRQTSMRAFPAGDRRACQEGQGRFGTEHEPSRHRGRRHPDGHKSCL